MIFGDPERRRREKQQEENSAEYKARMKAYNDSLQEQRLKNAKAAGIAEANRLANRKPLHVKLMGLASTVGKDLATSSKGRKQPALFSGNPGSLFNFGEPTPKHRRKKSTKKKARRK